MNRYGDVLRRFLSAFFFLFGLLQFLFFLRGIFPQLRAAGIHPLQTLLCLGAALLLSALHVMISVGGQESAWALRARLLLAGIPGVLICGVLSVYYGLPSLLLSLFGIEDRSTGAAVWMVGFMLSCAGFALGFLLLERRYRRTGEQYTEALRAYKAAAWEEGK